MINSLLQNSSFIWSIIQIWNIFWLILIPVGLILSFKEVSDAINQNYLKQTIPLYLYGGFLAVIVSVVQVILFFLSTILQDWGGMTVNFNFILLILLIIGWVVYSGIIYSSHKSEILNLVNQAKK